MSILVQGMNMPEEPVAIIIFPDGKVFRVLYPEQVAEAVPVPRHGRLIDADALISRCADEKGCYYGHESAVIGEAAESAPTIIPADPAEEGET